MNEINMERFKTQDTQISQRDSVSRERDNNIQFNYMINNNDINNYNDINLNSNRNHHNNTNKKFKLNLNTNQETDRRMFLNNVLSGK